MIPDSEIKNIQANVLALFKKSLENNVAISKSLREFEESSTRRKQFGQENTSMALATSKNQKMMLRLQGLRNEIDDGFAQFEESEQKVAQELFNKNMLQPEAIRAESHNQAQKTSEELSVELHKLIQEKVKKQAAFSSLRDMSQARQISDEMKKLTEQIIIIKFNQRIASMIYSSRNDSIMISEINQRIADCNKLGDLLDKNRSSIPDIKKELELLEKLLGVTKKINDSNVNLKRNNNLSSAISAFNTAIEAIKKHHALNLSEHKQTHPHPHSPTPPR